MPPFQAGVWREPVQSIQTLWWQRIQNAPPMCCGWDFIGSTSAIIQWCTKQQANEFIIMTESGVRYSLERLAPEKKFYFVANENCNCSECPYMKLNTLEKLRDCLETLEPRVEVPPDLIERAMVPLKRMLAVQ